jgi:two-component system competent response regulator ComA
VDDHPTVGYGTKAILERRFNCHVSYVMSGSQAMSKLHGQRYDILLCDYMMPTMDGLEVARAMKIIQADLKIMIYSGYTLHDHHNALMDAGVDGILSKESSVEELGDAITYLMRGYSVLPSELFAKLRLPALLTSASDHALIEKLQLSDEDIALLQGIVNGYSNKELAQLYSRSQRAVEYHITKLYSKCNVRSRIHLMRFALMYNVVSEDADGQQSG